MLTAQLFAFGGKVFLQSAERKVYAYSEAVDMRKSFNGLIHLTREVLKEDPLSGNVYVFTNRSRNLMKCLVWDRTGFVVVAKRLERGSFKIPGSGMKREVQNRIFALVFDGIQLGGR